MLRQQQQRQMLVPNPDSVREGVKVKGMSARAAIAMAGGRARAGLHRSLSPVTPLPNLIASSLFSVSPCSRGDAEEQDVLSQRGAGQGRARQLHQGRQEEYEAE